MPDISFDILYRPGGNVHANVASMVVYIDKFAKELGLTELQVDASKLNAVASALIRPDFPHEDGLDKASPFKKAANFFVWFVAEKPILDELPPDSIGEDLAGLPNHQNAILAYHLAIDCLHGAIIYRGEGGSVEEITLDSRIKVSYHFFRDFIEAYAQSVPSQDFKKVSLLFEQLAYRLNDSASYELVI